MENTKRSLLEIYPKRIDIPVMILTSGVLLAIGFSLPILTVRKLWEHNTFSILSGIQSLWNDKHFYLAALIFFFSFIFPIAKLLSLLLVWFVRLTDGQRKKLLGYLEAMGKWSMLDVFVAAIIIVSIKLGALASAQAEEGLYYFGSSILVAMLVSGFENRLARRYHIN